MTLRWSEGDYNRFLARAGKSDTPSQRFPVQPKRSKMRNIKTEVDGIVFDSKKEAAYYQNLQLLKMAGKILAVERQKTFLLQDTVRKNGKTHRKITYRADFCITLNDGSVRIVDVKASSKYKDPVYRMKRKLFEALYPDYEILEEYDDIPSL